MNIKKAVNQIVTNDLDVHYFGIYQNKSTSIAYLKDEFTYSDIRSLSKTIMTLLTGILIDKKDLSLDTFVYDIIKDNITLTNKDNLKNLKKIQIKHCLNHTLGYDTVLMMRNDIKDFKDDEFLNYLVNAPLVYEPGTHYLYSNAGFYLLSVVLEHYLDDSLENTFNKYLFKPLNIKEYKWEKYGPYLAGATRLHLKPLDLMKFGKVLLNDGKYKKSQIVSSDWIKYMKTPTTLTPKKDTPNRKFRRYAYGQGLWLSKDKNLFFGHGTDSQMLVIDKEKERIILAQSDHKNLDDVENIINEILED